MKPACHISFDQPSLSDALELPTPELSIPLGQYDTIYCVGTKLTTRGSGPFCPTCTAGKQSSMGGDSCAGQRRGSRLLRHAFTLQREVARLAGCPESSRTPGVCGKAERVGCAQNFIPLGGAVV